MSMLSDYILSLNPSGFHRVCYTDWGKTDAPRTILAVHEMPWVTGEIVACDGGLSLHSPIAPGA